MLASQLGQKRVRASSASLIRMTSSAGIKAMVTDNDGEISCSVEETNRIRALLGLRPLNMDKGDNEKEAVKNFRLNREREQK